MSERICPTGDVNVRYMGIDDPEEKKAYSFLLSYRVHKALFELLKGVFTWEECVRTMRRSKKLRDAAVAIIHNSIRSFVEEDRFNFEARNVILRDIAPGSERSGMMTTAQLFTDEYGISLVETFLFRTEMAHFRQLRQLGRFQSWEDYIQALNCDMPLRNALFDGFHDGLMRLDFRSGWLSRDITEVTKLFDSESSARR